MSSAIPADTAPGVKLSIFGPRYRVASVGILILMTIIAFEAMAVATALPTAARSLHGLAGYGWAFTGFLIASVLGMVLSGMRSDQRGPRLPLLIGLVLFIAGLLLASAAGQMWVLVAARVVQGFAVGLLITAMYVVMGEVYSDEIRPRMFAALASSWVIPGLVGPVVAGWITEQLSWRWVFGGLAPFAAVGGLMLLPSVRQLRSASALDRAADPGRIWFALLTALGIAGIAEVGERQTPLSVLLALAGVVAMVLGLRRLLPRGTVRFAPGVPAAIAFRGVLASVFVGMEVLVPLTLTVQRHYSPTMSGLPLMLTAVTWAAASQLQSRWHNPNRARLVGIGLVLISAAGVGMALVASRLVPGWAAFLTWPVAGFGAGFALTSASVVMLEYTNDADRGSDSASLQLADSSLSAVSAAFSGALVALAATGRISYGTGLSIAFLSMATIAALALSRAGQLRPALGDPVAGSDVQVPVHS
ncbi:MAG: MFS transporter [Actinomycetota bacterium]|nr:MFS transporter [Actinomycetota bacterium]MDQ2957255.1 MFS transporter [Actinomycetota bacterium]